MIYDPRKKSDYELFQDGQPLFRHQAERLLDWLDEKCSEEPENRQYFLDRVRLREAYSQRELDASEKFRGWNNRWDYD